MNRIQRFLSISLLLFQPVWSRMDVDRFWENIDADALMVRGFTDPETCNARMLESDANGDSELSPREFITFLQLNGPEGFLSGMDSMDTLALPLQSTFLALSCMCSDSRLTECCNDQVSIAGADGSANTQQRNDLFLICSLTRVAIDTVVGSITPSASPTEAIEPTLAPTTSPTVSPSSLPTTATPTLSPTAGPTLGPTAQPTPLPTVVASIAPTTASPTVTGSAVPSTVPTIVPSTMPSVPTISPAPSTPSASPTAPAISITYRVGVRGGELDDELTNELVDAMDALAPDVLAFRERKFLRQRKLQSILLPTSIDGVTEDECNSGLPEDDVCAKVQASVTLQDDPNVAEFQGQLEEAIASGALQEQLDTLHPDSRVYIIDDPLLDSLIGTRDIDDDDDGLKAGGVAGVAVASVILAGFCIVYYLAASRRREEKEELEPLDPAPQNSSEAELDETRAKGVTAGQLGAENKKKSPRRKTSSPHRPGDHDSDAGDSGWSSSAGVSSLNSADGDDEYENKMGESYGTPSQDEEELSVPNTPSSVTRSDLDSAIEAGDWAAVGATAALLAAGSDTASFSSRSITGPGTSTRDGSSVSSFEAARAAELDHLVDAGDWEGVVLAAAQFEASSTVASDSESRMSGSRMSGSRMSKSGEGAASMASSSALSTSKRQQDYRAQVEELVQRVVPEEAENVDEMMLQFRGREEELLETLRTMQERQIAQKARQGAQKAAKTEAKQQARDKRTLLGLAPSSSRSLGTGQITSSSEFSVQGSSRSLGTGEMVSKKSPSVREQKKSNLEKAIEAGDWEAVGEAAAMLNDSASASSADTEEINRLADGLSSQGSNLSGDSAAKRSSRAEELDKLIDKGDWMGVVQAAAEFESEEDKKSAKNKGTEPTEAPQQDTGKEKPKKKLNPEQEALQQAEIWMAIADKSKDDSHSEDRGAMNAADWAIGRSLAAMVEAENQGQSQSDRSKDTDSEGEI